MEVRTHIIGALMQKCRNCVKSFSGTRQGVQCESAGEEGGLEEDGKMEVDEEVDSKKKLDQRVAKTAAGSREAHVYAAGHAEQARRGVAAASGLLPEHQRSQKMQRLQDQ